MKKFKRIWIWDETLKKLDGLKNDGESRAELIDDIINFYDKKIIIFESKKERQKRLWDIKNI